MAGKISGAHFWIFFACFFLFLFFTGWFILSSYNLPQFLLIADSGLTAFLACLFTLAAVNLLRFYHPVNSSFVSSVVFIAVISFAASLLTVFVLLNIFKLNPEHEAFIRQSASLRVGFLAFVMLLILANYLLWNRVVKEQELESRKTQLEKLGREAELLSLRQQLQPHFLFNSLHSIQALVGQNPEVARRMIEQLAAFLRNTISHAGQPMSTWQEEVNQIQLYLHIETVRFGNRLKVIVQNEDNTLEWKIPSLLIQPLVENAVKYSLQDSDGEVSINIHSSLQNENLLVEISNPFSGTEPSSKGKGFGLSAVKRRLYLQYGRNDLIQIEKSENIFTVKLMLPPI